MCPVATTSRISIAFQTCESGVKEKIVDFGRHPLAMISRTRKTCKQEERYRRLRGARGTGYLLLRFPIRALAGAQGPRERKGEFRSTGR